MKQYDAISNARELIKIISQIDRFRSGMIIDIGKIDEKIDNLNNRSIRDFWNTKKEYLNKVLEKRLSDQYARKTFFTSFALRLIAGISILTPNFLFLLIAFRLDETFFNIHMKLNLPLVIILIVVIPYISLSLDYFLRRRSEKKLASNPNENIGIKKIIDVFIKALVREIRRGKLDPNKFKLKLFYKDYQGLEIIGRRGIVRKYYMAILRISNKSS